MTSNNGQRETETHGRVIVGGALSRGLCASNEILLVDPSLADMDCEILHVYPSHILVEQRSILA